MAAQEDKDKAVQDAMLQQIAELTGDVKTINEHLDDTLASNAMLRQRLDDTLVSNEQLQRTQAANTAALEAITAQLYGYADFEHARGHAFWGNGHTSC